MIRLSGHVCSRPIFPDLRVFQITESPISPDVSELPTERSSLPSLVHVENVVRVEFQDGVLTTHR